MAIDPTSADSRVVLVIYFLSVRSSYARNEEFAARGPEVDTVQFAWSAQGAWRIRTFAIDQDVHPWAFDMSLDELLRVERRTPNHFGDVIRDRVFIDSTDGLAGVRRELRTRGLGAQLEVGSGGLVFWAPEGSTYRSRSTPEPR